MRFAPHRSSRLCRRGRTKDSALLHQLAVGHHQRSPNSAPSTTSPFLLRSRARQLRWRRRVSTGQSCAKLWDPAGGNDDAADTVTANQRFRRELNQASGSRRLLFHLQIAARPFPKPLLRNIPAADPARQTGARRALALSASDAAAAARVLATAVRPVRRNAVRRWRSATTLPMRTRATQSRVSGVKFTQERGPC